MNHTNSDTQPHGDLNSDSVACEKCSFFNHSTKGCRRNLCEICGFNILGYVYI